MSDKLFEALGKLRELGVKFDPTTPKNEKLDAAKENYLILKGAKIKLDEGRDPGQEYSEWIDALYNSVRKAIENPEADNNSVSGSYRIVLDLLRAECADQP